ncbi:MAG: thiamine pyrophosphate-dependent dehydrogenase E1 component subunit alpha [Pseudomonadales bacterium]|nr:thiamine pyrophosphate-dependent dehydrogenase E1 component subunit alpha [Pseudomonadales bacterium]
MRLIRNVEDEIARLINSGEVKCPSHLCVGQEAIAVGVSYHLRNTDRVFGTHRSHSHYLALGGEPKSLFAEVLGRRDGCSKGMGGSMHLFGGKHGFLGSVPIVGGTVPIAVGAGLAAKKDGHGDVGVSYFGDGACEEGVVHEAFNLAAIYEIPVLFVCENNLFASHMDIHLRQPSDRMSRFAEANRINVQTVDGNDVLAVAKATETLLEKSRKGNGPGFLEVVTYRWKGHVGAADDVDVGVLRKEKDIIAWKKRDPIQRLRQGLVNQRKMDDSEFNAMDREISKDLMRAINEAKKSPYPEQNDLLDYVYA